MGIRGPVPCKRPLIVMGVSGAGKSSVGMTLARRLRVPYADADDFHTEAALRKMAGGTPLDDEDRRPWLQAVGAWLRSHSEGSVASCSALKRRYRDTLRSYAPSAYFLYLACDPRLAEERIDARSGHFMPASLTASQFEALEPLETDEAGVTVEVTPTKSVERIAAEFLAGCRTSF